ncbi:MAG: sigma-70 family RNA polymerase sigma factor [Planctomycetota bacterium]
MLNPDTRPSLIVRLADTANQSAWWEFVDQYEPFLKHLVTRLGVPTRDVSDATQQVLMAIAGSVGNWKDDGGEASFRRWVSRVARNVVIRFMTRQRKQINGLGGSQALSLIAGQQEDTEPAMEQQYEYELILWAAQRVKTEFAEASWQAFFATMIEDQSVAETAQHLGVSPGSIYMSRSRIIRRIRQLVAEVMQ